MRRPSEVDLVLMECQYVYVSVAHDLLADTCLLCEAFDSSTQSRRKRKNREEEKH